LVKEKILCGRGGGRLQSGMKSPSYARGLRSGDYKENGPNILPSTESVMESEKLELRNIQTKSNKGIHHVKKHPERGNTVGGASAKMG